MAVAACAVLTGCAPDSGIVTDRKTDVTCIGNHAFSCKPTWKVQVTDPHHKDRVYTDQQDTGWAKVTEAEYARCVIGAAYPACKGGAR